jgi:rhamnose transport system ATP-binding protein
VSFDVHAGEIVGFTGLVGAGRTEVVQTLFGIERYDSGKIFFEGKEIQIRKPQDAMRRGIGLLTEDRQECGLILDWGIGANITLPELRKYAKRNVTNEKVENTAAKQLAESVDVKAVTIFDKASSLSGGNHRR